MGSPVGVVARDHQSLGRAGMGQNEFRRFQDDSLQTGYRIGQKVRARLGGGLRDVRCCSFRLRRLTPGLRRCTRQGQSLTRKTDQTRQRQDPYRNSQVPKKSPRRCRVGVEDGDRNVPPPSDCQLGGSEFEGHGICSLATTWTVKRWLETTRLPTSNST